MDALVQDPAFDFRKTVAVLGDAPQLDQCQGRDEVRMVRRGMDRVTIAADMACRGMVILGDSFYPGWRVTIDGRPAAIREVYGALRGVVVESGQHTVDMIYRPLSILGGAALSLLGLAITLAIPRFHRAD